MDAIVNAAIRLADAEGLDAVSMARVAAELGFTTMSLYRYVANKDELLQLMWNASTLGAEDLAPGSLAPGGEGLAAGEGSWRDRLRRWTTIQRDVIDQHPWITQMPMPAPPTGPNSMLFVEHGLATMDGTTLADSDKLRVIGLLSSYTLSEARMAADAMRAGAAVAPQPPRSFELLLRELLDEPTYPRLYRLAWEPEPDNPPTERDQFLFGVELILDGVQALIDRHTGGD
jgi:AcrR family transcriptional regulator